MLGGLAIVTLGSSIYLVASREVSRSLEFNPWYSLGVALVLTAIVTGVLYYFYRRATLRDTGALQTVSMAINARSKVMPWDIHQRYDFLLIGAALLAAAVAVGSSLTLNTQAERYEGDLALTFAYPSGWAANADEGGEWLARELTGPGTIKPVLQVSENKSRADSDLQVLAANFTAILDAEKALFVELDSTELEVAGQPAIQVNYSYAAQTASGPVVVRGVETYVTNGDNVIAMRYEAQADVFERGLPAYQRLLNSVQFQ
ncbi:MAG: hypothetical protein ACFB51_18170 [Anaerolineae bacterium]